MRRVNWTITEHQHRELKRLSQESGLPISEIVRRALDQYFNSISAQRDTVEQVHEAKNQATTEESEVLP